MTILLFSLEPQRICLAMDTLCRDATVPEVAHNYCSKAVLLPHLHGVIAGTGLRSVIYDWARCVQELTVARDITMLDAIASRELPRIFEAHAIDTDLTTTIYHFGFDKGAGSMVAFVYRSTTDFASEQLPNSGIGIKPPDGIDAARASERLYEIGLPAWFIEVAQEQKKLDDLKSPPERVGVGGELQFIVLTPDVIQASTCFQFPDFETQFADALLRSTRA